MKRLDNNKGFTLAELIIAVAILAIAVSPLIANFIQSSKMNMAGRENLDAMNLAQDIMEGLSGYTADEIDKRIEEVILNESGTESLKGNVLPTTSVYSGVDKVSDPDDKVLKYKISNVETIGSVKNVYDAEVILDPTGDDQKEFNDQIVADISEINQYYDAVFTVPTEKDVVSAIGVLKGRSSTALTDEQWHGKLKREINIEILNTNPSGTPNYKVKVSRKYGPAQGEQGVLGLGSSDSHTIVTDNICRMDSDKFPRNVYIYFKGIEGATYSDVEKKERIVVSNNTGQDITVYLIRTQETHSQTGEVLADEITYGNSFGCDVAVTSTTPDGALTKNVHIVSNLRFDLNAISPRYNFRVKTEDGEDIYDANGEPKRDEKGQRLYPEIPTNEKGEKLSIVDSTYNSSRANYYYNTELVNEETYLDYFSDGYASKDKHTLYKVTINLYDVETGEKVATYDGGVSN